MKFPKIKVNLKDKKTLAALLVILTMAGLEPQVASVIVDVLKALLPLLA